jgi:Metalloenzyme superfamily
MRYLVSLCLILMCKATSGFLQVERGLDVPTENKVFLITLDGFRWQELFKGADSALLFNSRFTKDSTATKYWAANYTQRRKKLLPFIWNVVATQGQLFGNRTFNNRVNVSNLYRLSYPGYNEILTGRADPTIYSNERKRNQNTTLLEYLNEFPAYNGSVAAFTSWNVFPYIINQKRSNVYVNCTFDQKSSSLFKLKTAAGASLPRFYDEDQNTRNDWATFFAAQHYIKHQLPKVVFIGLGGTDEYGHQKKYGRYLQQAAQADSIIAELWNLVQSMPFYKDHTTFIITTDHGRGKAARNWHKHGFLTEGSSQTWLAMLGAGISPNGELKSDMQLYQDQVAGTVSALLGVRSFERQSIPVSFYTMPLGQGQ